MKKDVLVSIIVTVYNAEKTLEKCICSILSQTYSYIEMVLVDDGSTDSSRAICDSAMLNDSRVKVIHQENQGIVMARRTGIANSTGDYFTFLDSDDYIDVDGIEKLVVSTVSDDVDILAFGLVEECKNYSVDKVNHFAEGYYDYVRIREVIWPSMLSYGEFFDFGILPNLVCKLIRREFWDGIIISVNPIVTFGEDADVTYQLLIQSNSLEIYNYCPYHYIKYDDTMVGAAIEDRQIQALEQDLKVAFGRTSDSEQLLVQLQDYMTFVRLLKKPELLLGNDEILNTRRIALYGAGGFGQAVSRYLKEKQVVWVDRDYKRYSNLDREVLPVEMLLEVQKEYDVVYVAVLNTSTYRTIYKQLLDIGIIKKIVGYGRIGNCHLVEEHN